MVGEIRYLERYKQLFNHSPWDGILPNGITPSDIDVVFDNKMRARLLFCEFTCKETLWEQKPYGQRTLYMQLLRTNNYENACVLCNHNVPAEQQINSIIDVLSFQMMRIPNRSGEVKFYPSRDKAYDGSKWLDFVKMFYGLDNELGAW